MRVLEITFACQLLHYVAALTDVDGHGPPVVRADRDRFLPVVTGFPPSAREAGASVGTMHDRFSRVDLTGDQSGSRH